jgi:RimJ/RimL family protein N-acetyltransferase
VIVDFRPPRPRDVRHIAARMAPMDALECEIFGRTPAEGLERSLGVSDMAVTCVIDGRTQAMLGVAGLSLIDDMGSPWLLGTSELRRHARLFATAAPALIKAMHERYSRLTNYVHADNLVSIRWLSRLGFDFPGEVAYVGEHKLLKFTRES